MQLYSNILGSIPNLTKNCGYLIKFELSIFVIWSGPVDKVAVFQTNIFQIAEYNSRVQIQPVQINKILTCKSSFLVFIYGVLQGDNFVVGYFYIF